MCGAESRFSPVMWRRRVFDQDVLKLTAYTLHTSFWSSASRRHRDSTGPLFHSGQDLNQDQTNDTGEFLGCTLSLIQKAEK